MGYLKASVYRPDNEAIQRCISILRRMQDNPSVPIAQLFDLVRVEQPEMTDDFIEELIYWHSWVELN